MKLRALLALSALALAATCAPPSQQDGAVYGTLRVHVPPADWDTDHLAWARLAATELSLAGPAVVLVDDEASADVVVRHLGDGLASCEGQPGGRYTLGAREVFVDPVCVQGGELTFRAAVAHELFHAYLYARFGYRGHICLNGDYDADCDPEVRGVALLNPRLGRGGDQGPTLEEAYVGDVPAWYPQDGTDFVLVRRLAARR